MARREGHLHAPPERVFEVLRDGYSYVRWVIGTTKIRHVDANWPEVGSNLHYTAGWWPFRVQDRTVVTRYEPDRRLTLEALGKVSGSALIDIEVIAEGDGSRVVIDEHPVAGPAAKIHNPAVESMLRLRNVRMMRKLKDVVEEGSRQEEHASASR